ncbi:MAG TPA: CHAT domain-containing protein, partial [Polyangium sp.]|nr:CHAT domain-containing protein [Polyangium sp.]
MNPPIQPTWIEFTITSDESRIFVGTKGSRAEHLPQRELRVPRSEVVEFARLVEVAARYEQGLSEKGLAAAHNIQKALLDEDRRALFSRLQEASGGMVLVRFVVEDPALHAIPWEALCKPDQKRGFWSTSADVFPVRTIASGDPWSPRDVSGAIEVRAIAPTNGAGVKNLQLALKDRIHLGEVKWLEPLEGRDARVLELLDRAGRGPGPHVLHFLGHGRLSSSNIPELRLADDRDGEEEWVAVDLLAEPLREHFKANLRLIVLEACEGAAPGDFASAAEIFVKAGADAVVAHLWPVRADVALLFSMQFYRALTQSFRGRGDVAWAANEARRAVFIKHGASAFCPVVVLRGTDSRVFRFPEQVPQRSKLPAIVEFLPNGDAGENEFAKLVRHLLWQQAMWSNLPYLFVRLGQTEVSRGATRLSFDANRDLPAYCPIWSPTDIRTGRAKDLIVRLLMTPGVRCDHTDGTWSTATRLYLMFPRDISASERAWLGLQPRWEGYTAVDVWGMADLENLLRPVPGLFARYYRKLAPQELPTFDPSFDFRAFTPRYCEAIVREFEHLNLVGFPPVVDTQQETRVRIRITDFFLGTVFRAQHNREQRTALLELVKNERSVLVLGDAGTGKTMLLKFLALVHARGAATLADYTPPPARIPIPISLRRYAQELEKVRNGRGQDLSLLEYFAQRCDTSLRLRSVHPASFDGCVRMGEAILLLDGLDEVGLPATRREIAQRIQEFRHDYPDCPIWVTSRTHGYTHDVALPNDDFEHVVVGALDDAQIDDFLDRWYRIQFANDPRKQSEGKASLREAIFRNGQVRALAENPLLLTLMAFVHRFPSHLPQDRGALYERCVTLILDNCLAQQDAHDALPIFAPMLTRPYLEALAFHVQEYGLLVEDATTRAPSLFSHADALAFLTVYHATHDRRTPAISPEIAKRDMSLFLDYALGRLGLLVDRRLGQLSFLHLSFQEYLAATHET